VLSSASGAVLRSLGRLYIAPGQNKRFSRPENVRQLCKVEKVSGSYEKWEQEARRKGLLGLKEDGIGRVGPEPAPWVVMADPDGNELDVLRALTPDE
jgi:hypothetical protein